MGMGAPHSGSWTTRGSVPSSESAGWFRGALLMTSNTIYHHFTNRIAFGNLTLFRCTSEAASKHFFLPPVPFHDPPDAEAF